MIRVDNLNSHRKAKPRHLSDHKAEKHDIHISHVVVNADELTRVSFVYHHVMSG